MKYAIRHQAAGILPERYDAPPSAAFVVATGKSFEPFFGKHHPKTKQPWWLTVIELDDNAPGNAQIHERCTTLLAQVAAQLAFYEASTHRYCRIAQTLGVALLIALAGGTYVTIAQPMCPSGEAK